MEEMPSKRIMRHYLVWKVPSLTHEKALSHSILALNEGGLEILSMAIISFQWNAS